MNILSTALSRAVSAVDSIIQNEKLASDLSTRNINLLNLNELIIT